MVWLNLFEFNISYPSCSDGTKPHCYRCTKQKKLCTYNRKKNPNFVPLKRSGTKLDSKSESPPAQDNSTQEFTSANLIFLLSSYLDQKNRENKQPAQFRNSDLKQLLTSIGLDTSNVTSDQLPLQIYPPEPRIVYSRDELPYPPEVIDDMLNSYFENSIWPSNFLHRPSIIANRYTIPRALLGIICAQGCKFSKYMPYLSLKDDVPNVLLQYAKKSFDFEDMSMNGLITNIQFTLFYAFTGRHKSMWIYINSFLALVRFLRLYEDPDSIERESVVRFSLIEKEMRRRSWWTLRILGNSQPTMFKDFPIDNVRKPLPNEAFEGISENQDCLMPLNFPIVTQKYNVDSITFEIMIWRERVTKFHSQVCKNLWDEVSSNAFDFLETLVQATKLQTELQQWFENKPEWFKNVQNSENIYVNLMPPKNSDQIPWLAVSIHVLYYALSMYPYRFLLIFVSGSMTVSPLQIDISKEFISVAIGFCRNFQNFLLNSVKNCLLRLDPKFEHFCPVIFFAMSQAGVFSSVMSQFDETEELRLNSKKDFEFCVAFYASISLTGRYTIANTVISDLEIFDSTPPGEMKSKMIRFLWANGLYSYGEHIRELGFYSFQNPMVSTPLASK
ncbi:hypothetical protein HK096_004171 [Nowakowskiella sp. JEL0078]|nr:hypothetical protein HK096_004171 [Nowakowskiella sp. JEL0078]